MRTHLKNNSAKFHSDPICNEGALGILKRIAPRRQEEEQEEEEQRQRQQQQR